MVSAWRSHIREEEFAVVVNEHKQDDTIPPLVVMIVLHMFSMVQVGQVVLPYPYQGIRLTFRPLRALLSS